MVTDGEMRRVNFQDSFSEAVEGYDANAIDLKENERRVEGAAPPALGSPENERQRHARSRSGGRRRSGCG